MFTGVLCLLTVFLPTEGDGLIHNIQFTCTSGHCNPQDCSVYTLDCQGRYARIHPAHYAVIFANNTGFVSVHFSYGNNRRNPFWCYRSHNAPKARFVPCDPPDHVYVNPSPGIQCHVRTVPPECEARSPPNSVQSKPSNPKVMTLEAVPEITTGSAPPRVNSDDNPNDLSHIDPNDAENLALVMSRNVALKMDKSDCYICHLLPTDGRGWPMYAAPYGPDDWLTLRDCDDGPLPRTVDMVALATAGNFTWHPRCPSETIRLDLVTDRVSAARAATAGQALETLCQLNKSLPCQWDPETVKPPRVIPVRKSEYIDETIV